jgi:hypothetical protein
VPRLDARLLRRVSLFFLLTLPLVIFCRALVGGEAFVPADLLSYVAPWSHYHIPTAGWNVLRYDGVTQFYPWRLLTSRIVHSGRIPLWNPYALSAAGGTPLLANSQSAPFYPINFLFYALPASLVWYGFGLTGALHMGIAVFAAYRFLRRLELRRSACLLGASAFGLSAPVITWLALPTFLAVACWIPCLLLAVRGACAGGKRSVAYGVGAAACVGLMLLAGHLQIALYGLMLGAAYAVFRLVAECRGDRAAAGRAAATLVAALALGILFALPQLLPAVELSRNSHRAAAGPTGESYGQYISTALPVRSLATLLLPNFFGHPNPAGPNDWYWNTNNYAEWALYAGVAPLLLAGFALGLPWNGQKGFALPSERGFFGAVAVAALLIAMGTPLNAPLFFGIPGFSQTGNPARILILFVFSIAVLAAIGLDALLRDDFSRAARERAALIGNACPALLAAVGVSAAARFQQERIPGLALADLLAPVRISLVVGTILTVVSVGLIVWAARARSRRTAWSAAFLALTVVDLLYWGYGYNPTSPPSALYPQTPGIAYLHAHAASDDLIAPINRNWSIAKSAPPRGAILPPNALTVFGLHDLQGYDSLFLKTAKDQVRDAGGGLDPSPPENGNMVFIKSGETAIALGARFLVYAPDSEPTSVPAGCRLAYAGRDMIVYESRAAEKFDGRVGRAYAPASFRIGLFGALWALATVTGWGVARRGRRQN